jgi:hypothetical protein
MYNNYKTTDIQVNDRVELNRQWGNHSTGERGNVVGFELRELCPNLKYKDYSLFAKVVFSSKVINIINMRDLDLLASASELAEIEKGGIDEQGFIHNW